MLRRRGILSVDLDGMTADADLLSAFDVEEMAPEALLFQSGCLTIVDEKDEGDGPVYRLGYPNREVRQSLNRQLLRLRSRASGQRPVRRLPTRRRGQVRSQPGRAAAWRIHTAICASSNSPSRISIQRESGSLPEPGGTGRNDAPRKNVTFT